LDLNREGRLRTVLEAVFGPDGLRLSDDDGPGATPEWDSLAHLNLILAIEAEFGVAFATAEIPELRSLRKIRARLERGDVG
jgi:acyl carrier protein